MLRLDGTRDTKLNSSWNPIFILNYLTWYKNFKTFFDRKDRSILNQNKMVTMRAKKIGIQEATRLGLASLNML